MNRMDTAIKTWVLAGLAILLVTGCKTSTVQSRKQERASAYQELGAEMRQLVDNGQIAVGMPMEGVYIAWGKPDQILRGESPTGRTVVWIYHGTVMQEYRFWNYRHYGYGRGFYPEPYLDIDYLPRDYTRAEVVFEDGKVKSWRTLARPPQ